MILSEKSATFRDHALALARTGRHFKSRCRGAVSRDRLIAELRLEPLGIGGVDADQRRIPVAQEQDRAPRLAGGGVAHMGDASGFGPCVTSNAGPHGAA